MTMYLAVWKIAMLIVGSAMFGCALGVIVMAFMAAASRGDDGRE